MGKATLIFKEKLTLKHGLLRDGVIWKVPKSPRYPDGIKYRLALVNPFVGTVLILFDNHYPKGHHYHLKNGDQRPYNFESVAYLVEDYLDAVIKEEMKNEG
ncbi:MAG: hypothetical protein HY072_10435 [Deltaproteobacteria bacterium]|nr:hypothetical protein [Deltaproteobacteria bacterium]